MWLFIWQVVVAVALVVVMINTAATATKMTRSAIQTWNAPRGADK
jgi:hypothetical protein